MRLARDGASAAVHALHDSVAGRDRDATFALTLAAPRPKVLSVWEGKGLRYSPLAWSRDGSELLLRRLSWRDREAGERVLVLDARRGRMSDLVACPGDWSRACWAPALGEVVVERRCRHPDGRGGTRWAHEVWALRRAGGALTLVARDASLAGVGPRRVGTGYWVFLRRLTEVGGDLWPSIWVASNPPARQRQLVPWRWRVKYNCDVSPDGCTLALLRYHPERACTDLILLTWYPSTEARVANLPEPVVEAVWSPKGDRVACLGAGGVWTYGLAGGSARRLACDLGYWDALQDAAWMPDGERLLVGRGPRLYLVDARRESATVLLELRGRSGLREPVAGPPSPAGPGAGGTEMGR